jgi:hypothetical protein
MWWPSCGEVGAQAAGDRRFRVANGRQKWRRPGGGGGVATWLWLGGGSNLGAFGLSATGGRARVGEDARGHVGLSAVMQTAPKFWPPLHRRREWGQNVSGR